MDETQLIKHTIVHTLNYTVIELMRRAYQLAMTDELQNLAGLVDTRLDKWMRSDDEELIVIDDDIDLLSTVDEIGVKIVVDSMINILEKNKVFQIIQNIDLEDALRDTEASQEGSGILATYVLELRAADSYRNIMDDLVACYTSVNIIIYHCIMMLELNTTEVWDEGMQSWIAQGNEDEYTPKTSSGQLLFDLKDELNRDSVRLADYSYKK